MADRFFFQIRWLKSMLTFKVQLDRLRVSFANLERVCLHAWYPREMNYSPILI